MTAVARPRCVVVDRPRRRRSVSAWWRTGLRRCAIFSPPCPRSVSGAPLRILGRWRLVILLGPRWCSVGRAVVTWDRPWLTVAGRRRGPGPQRSGAARERPTSACGRRCRRLRPEFAVYFASTVGADYQVGMWLPYFLRIGARS